MENKIYAFSKKHPEYFVTKSGTDCVKSCRVKSKLKTENSFNSTNCSSQRSKTCVAFNYDIEKKRCFLLSNIRGRKIQKKDGWTAALVRKTTPATTAGPTKTTEGETTTILYEIPLQQL